MNVIDDTGRLNLDWAATLVGGLAAAGVRDIVLSPGARSTPLTLACLRHPALRCEVVLDERSAAWFALGRARSGGLPVALVCTSGTAAANWLPAVVEANQDALPLLLLSADRPPELQGCGANQTIVQDHLFAGQVRASHAPGAPFPGFERDWLRRLMAQAVAETRWPLPGPVHINLPFREPLLPVDATIPAEAGRSTPIDAEPPVVQPAPAAVAALAARLEGRRGIIVCGGGIAAAEFPAALAALAARLDCPILADPHSGLRFGTHAKAHVCTAHERWLRDDARRASLTPEWVLRFGAMPVTRTLQTYVAACDEHYLVDAHGRWPDPQHRTRQLLRGDPVAACTALAGALRKPAMDGWSAAFRDADAARGGDTPPPEGDFLAALCRALPADSRLFCGNSMPIRDLAAWSGSGDTPLAIHANRGASGIDGNIATAAGLAVDGPTVAVLGDLTAQHDLGSLVLLRDRPLVVVVINNGGGGIFDFLPAAVLPEFERGWQTPQALRFDHAAAAFGIAHRATADPAETVALVVAALGDRQPLLVEFEVDRAASLRQRMTNG